jgi:hypothetical protein
MCRPPMDWKTGEDRRSGSSLWSKMSARERGEKLKQNEMKIASKDKNQPTITETQFLPFQLNTKIQKKKKKKKKKRLRGRERKKENE